MHATDPEELAEPIRLVYSVTDADQRAAVRASVMSEPQVRWTRNIALVLPIVMVAWSLSAGWSLGLALFRNAFWIVLALLFLFAYVPWTVRSIVRAMRRADPDWRREQEVAIGADGIRIASSAETTEIPWSAVRRASETRDVVLLHIGARILFLPKRMVASQSSPAALRRLLRARLGPSARFSEEAG
jgi:hypothetical protein